MWAKILCLSVVLLSFWACTKHREEKQTSEGIVIIGDQSIIQTVPSEVIDEIAELINDSEMEFYEIISQNVQDMDLIVNRLYEMTKTIKKRTKALKEATPDQINYLRNCLKTLNSISTEEIETASHKLIEIYEKSREFRKAYDAYRNALNNMTIYM